LRYLTGNFWLLFKDCDKYFVGLFHLDYQPTICNRIANMGCLPITHGTSLMIRISFLNKSSISFFQLVYLILSIRLPQHNMFTERSNRF